MTADNLPEIQNMTDNQGEIRPSAGKDRKLEDKIADEKDEALTSESTAKTRRRES